MIYLDGRGSFCFSDEEVNKGLLTSQVKWFMDYNLKSEDGYYYEIHIWTDGTTTILDYVHRSYDNGGAKFELVEEDEKVMKEVFLPDNSCVMCYDDEDAKETLDDFLKEHADEKWYKNSYGHWVNGKEEEMWKKEFGGENGKDS